MAWQVEQSFQCPGCGLPTYETMADDAEDEYEVHALACHACRAKAAKREGANYPDGTYLTVQRG